MKSLISFVNEASTKELLLKDITAEKVIDLLQVALAEELNAWFQYTIAAPFLVGNERTTICEKYKEWAKDELEDHGFWLIERINQLSGKPMDVISPEIWNKKADHKYITPDKSFDVTKSILQNIEAEKGAIETYTRLEEELRDKDIVSHTKIKEILADEQEHLSELQDLLNDLNSK